ncbi:F-box/kelch-repeat protein At3g23880-like [Coffea eugenioides]|uniref:F-box/kelch-repeat protein At3g23880-like n=1 Tax=Coffea eugenioides TaxID=49369 RepID=UPI000F61555A|nr:F-box/kelch-repeat protein At3g23880-like [Coffea eugenioides]
MEPSSSSSRPYLPYDSILEILSRLPVKTLVRFCCVCKLWRKLITSDGNFITSHLQNTLNNNSKINSRGIKNVFLDCNRILVGCTTCYERPDPRIKELTEQFMISAGDSNLCRLLFAEGYFSFAGCFNGIICFYGECDYECVPHIYLWNPAVNQCIILPRTADWEWSHNVVCFTYDPVTEDYQVVQISHQIEVGVFKFQIYSLSNNSWKPLSSGMHPPRNQILHLVSEYNWNAVVYNGFPHWLAKDKKDSTLFMNILDMNQEKIREILLPDSLSNHSHDPNLELFQGCLCITHGWNFSKVHPFELWVMKEHGEDISWTKQIVISGDSTIRPLPQRITGVTTIGNLLAAVKKDRLGRNFLVLYDPENQRVEEPMQKELEIPRVSVTYLAFDYVPSLVRLIRC